VLKPRVAVCCLNEYTHADVVAPLDRTTSHSVADAGSLSITGTYAVADSFPRRRRSTHR
jgi:hypothetical protein